MSEDLPWPLRFQDDTLELLDQTRLPAERRVLRLREPAQVAEAIRAMRVRGAPAIGLAAAYGVALAALRASERGEDPARAALDAAALLRATRPTAFNLVAALERMERHAAAGADAARLVREARALHEEDVTLSRRIIEHGQSLLALGGRYLTVCHTGPLATGGLGTALGVLLAAHARERVRCVWVLETRPRLQGSKLTALELARAGVPFTVVADGAAASLIARGLVDQAWVGADRVARNGDVVNKVGTYAVALACASHRVPLHAAFPWTTFDPGLPEGSACPIELRDPAEVLEVAGVRIGSPGDSAYNPAFDVTPARLVSAWITDRGAARSPADLEAQAG